MLTQKLLQHWTSMASRRFISQSLKNFESKGVDSANKASVTDSHKAPGRAGYIPSNFDKWLLVWVKRYPKGQVPEKISEEIIHQAKSRGRIKAANYMIGATVLLCITTAMYAKGEAKKGNTIAKQRQEWHERLKEEGRMEKDKIAQDK